MKTVRAALENVKRLVLPHPPLPVERTCAEAVRTALGRKLPIADHPHAELHPGELRLAVVRAPAFPAPNLKAGAPPKGPWVYLKLGGKDGSELVASHPSLLYAYTVHLVEDRADRPVAEFTGGKYFAPPFKWHRPLFDYLLTQVWRSARKFDPETHLREMARAAYTHVEVNGLGAPAPFETGVPGEFYAPFYAYCLALDQYVASDLNRGIYPESYLQANLDQLIRYAELARKYGLVPGLLCFEPRSVPEAFFQKYPTLRGARVDHPLRSRKPRYSLALAHPLVQEHYRQLLQRLLQAVPDLAYLSIWSNDSGAGFEHTASLYVGRNGGPYLIREWRTHEQIARAAGENIVRFLKLLRDAGREIQPDFRVSLRLEPFAEEHDALLENLEPGLDLETPSLLGRGYDFPYPHPEYDDVTGVAGSIHHRTLLPEEKSRLQQLAERGLTAHFIYSQGNGFNLEPLLAIPFPWALYEKLRALAETGVACVANLGGATPSKLAPFHINQEVFRAFMLQPDLDLEAFLQRQAAEWAGASDADPLLEIWRLSDAAVRALPVLPLYSSFGFVWLRLWVRPLLPDLLAVPEAERRYYEAHMVSPANNPNLADLGRDVLFRLITQESGQRFAERVDERVRPPLEQALGRAAESAQTRAAPVFRDLYDRLRALQCWVTTLRNVAGWCAGVYGYLESDAPKTRRVWRAHLDRVIDSELENTRALLDLWRTADTEFMVVSQTGETPFLYGENFGELLERRIRLMEQYRHSEPRIEEGILWKV